MMTVSKGFSALCYSSCALLLLVNAGCGGGSDLNTHPVTGTVTYNGSPVTTGTVMFAPDTAEAQPATGQINESGEYEILTTASSPGAMVGTYKVAINATEGVATMDAQGRPVQPKDLVPKKYGDIATSGLTATVAEGDNEINFALAD